MVVQGYLIYKFNFYQKAWLRKNGVKMKQGDTAFQRYFSNDAVFQINLRKKPVELS